MKFSLLNQALIAALVVVPGIASADTLNFVGPDQTNIYDMNITGPGAYSGDVYVGSLLFTLNNTPPQFDLYCVDLQHDISAGNSYGVTIYNTDTMATSNPAMYAAGNIYAAVNGSVTNSDQAAGLQIALWDTVAPGAFTISGVSSTVQNYVNTDLAFAATPGNALYYMENGGTGQSQLGGANNPGHGSVVPEPSSWAALAVGGLGLLRRRKR